MRFKALGFQGLLLAISFALVDVPAIAMSALAAWRFNSNGQLELRTRPNVRLQAYFEAGSRLVGPRVWVDLPGAPQRSRSVPGTGALKEIRIGKPQPTMTRLVMEFQPGTRLDPNQLKLVGIARDRWRLDFKGLPTNRLRSIGEGAINAPTTSPLPVTSAGMPTVPRGRYRVVIDPGHGGPDPGAVGRGGLRETNVVLDVALQVAQLLRSKGVQVVMTRTTEVDVDLPPRVSLANRSRADAFVSLHANALSMARPDVNGIETFYYQGGRSRDLAASIQREILAVSPGSPNRGARPGRFYVLRRTAMPAALAEMGFVTGQLDAPRLASSNHRRRLAQAVTKGILNYLR